MLKRTAILAIVLLLVASCKQTAEVQTTESYILKGDTVQVLNQRLLTEKMKFVVAREELITREVVTAGTIQAIPTQYAYIAPPFAGRVMKSYIKLGEHVSKNKPLFEIISSDYTLAQKEFFQAESDFTLAQTNFKRQEDLKENGVGSQKELDEARNVLYVAEKEYENATAAIELFHTNPHHMKLGQPLVIRAPIDGEVIADNLVTGQYLTSDSEHVAIVANLSNVWVAAQVKEKDIRFIHKGDKMDIHVASLPGVVIQGVVHHIDEAIDTDTRSIRVLSICDNADRQLKLGMYVTVHFFDEARNYIVVPEKAVLQGEHASYIYVKIDDNKLIKTSVKVISTNDGKAVITGAVKAGETIVGEGGYYFK